LHKSQHRRLPMSKQLKEKTAQTLAIAVGALCLSLTLPLGAKSACAGDWNTIPSTYSHDLKTGRRTNQYRQETAAYYQPAPVVVRSGYRQIRGNIQVGGISDNTHIVERFGEPVRPYGEWRFPYRPYSAPYPAWGPPPAYPAFGLGFAPGYGRPYAGRGGGFAPGAGGPGAGGPGPGGPGPGGGIIAPPGIDPRRIPVPATPNRWRPWHDGGYPNTPRDYYERAPEPYWPTP
jgi:hypothetical protein